MIQQNSVGVSDMFSGGQSESFSQGDISEGDARMAGRDRQTKLGFANVVPFKG